MSDAPYLSLVPPWPSEEGPALLETRIFRIGQRRATSPTRPAHSATFYYMDSADWVNVIALTDADEVVMIEQFRHGSQEITLEIPGGIVDPGEDAMQAGARELLEETGFRGDPILAIGVVRPNPAIQNNRCHTGLIRGARRIRAQTLDENEEIAIRLVPRAEIPGLIRSGVIQHAMVVAAFYHLSLLE